MSRKKELPSIPVAPLQETLDRYLKSLKLLLTTEQFEETQKVSFIDLPYFPCHRPRTTDVSNFEVYAVRIKEGCFF